MMELVFSGLVLVFLGLLLGATWTSQSTISRMAKERRRINEEWGAERRTGNDCGPGVAVFDTMVAQRQTNNHAVKHGDTRAPKIYRTGLVQVRASGRRIVTAFTVFALSIGCFLAGMSAAITGTASAVNFAGSASEVSSTYARGMHIASGSDLRVLACGGECPGFCPCPLPESKDGATPASTT